jgi:hypothetical protein
MWRAEDLGAYLYDADLKQTVVRSRVDSRQWEDS